MKKAPSVNNESPAIETKPTAIDPIEQFILDSGSDHLGTFGGSFEGGVQAQQVPDELAPCIKAMLDDTIENYLEIGSAAGGSAFLIDHYFHPKRMVLIDNNQHPKAHIRSYVLRDIPHEEIIGDSHHEDTVACLRQLRVCFDAILIDGDHMYDGVKADVKTYSEFLKPNGFLIFHDSQIGYPYGCAGVAVDLKQDKKNWKLVDEYISKTEQKCGILLLRKVEKAENVNET